VGTIRVVERGMRVTDTDKLLEAFLGATKGTVESLLGAAERTDVNKQKLMREHLRIMANTHLDISRRVEQGKYDVSQALMNEFRAYRKNLETHTWLKADLNDWVHELTRDWKCSACRESVAMKLEIDPKSETIIAVCKACESLTPLSESSQHRAHELLTDNSFPEEGA